MSLIEELQAGVPSETSPFRAQLLREDIARLQKLAELAASADDTGSYRQAGRKLGWTPMDARTAELGEALERLLDAVRDETRGADAEATARARAAWLEITRIRLERMLGCLSTRMPMTED